MADYINTNIAAMNAQNNLSTSQASLATSLQRLSSGLRINSAADDAAGYAIATRMTSQINGLNQAARNANDGISLAQTASGALSAITDNLQTMRDLAVQAANASTSASDRASINNEMQQLSAEIQRVATSTTFNGTQLLDGSFNAQTFQVGANQGETINIASIANMQTSQLGGALTSYAANVTGTATTTALNAGDLTLNGFQVGASQLGSAAGQTTASAYSIASAINAISANTNVIATANSNTVTGLGGSANITSPTLIAANTFSINGVNIGAIAAGGNAAGQGANLAAAINLVTTQTGVTATADAVSGALVLTAADGRDINISTSAANLATLQTQTGLSASQIGTAVAAGTAIPAGAFDTPPFAGSSLAAGAITANGVNVGAVTFGTGAYSAATAAGLSTTASMNFTVGALTAGSTYSLTFGGTGNTGVINFVATGNTTTDAQAIKAAYAALGGDTLAGAGNVLASTGGKTFDVAVTAVRTAADITNGVTVAQGAVAATAAIATSNANFTVSNGTLGKQAANGGQYSAQVLANALNAALASAPGGAAVNGTVTSAGTASVTYVVGSNTTFALAQGGTALNPAAATANQVALTTATGLTACQLGTQASNVANHGTISLTSTAATGIVVGGAAPTEAGLQFGQTNAALSSTINTVASLNTLSAVSALSAISAIDGALATVNNAAGSLGAYQNRFTSAVSNMQSAVLNLTASRSRIQDTDFAAETGNLTRSQILQQAGTAMLAQANAAPNGVMALLR